MDRSKYEIQELVSRLRRDQDDDGDLSRTELVRERQEAADTIESLLDALRYAESVCEKAKASMDRWRSGKHFDPSGPEATLRGELYDLIRPGARAGIKKLLGLLDGQSKP